jgi:hypothetical protein
LLKIRLDFLLRKTGASLNFKVEGWSLHINPDLCCQFKWKWWKQKFELQCIFRL